MAMDECVIMFWDWYNENTNGLIRQFFPKNIRLNDISQEQTKRVERLLNNRPRKVLDLRLLLR